MTRTTTQLAGLDDDALIDLASTDLERELARRLGGANAEIDALTEELREATEDLEIDGLDDARVALATLRKCLAEAQECKAKLDEFLNSL